MIALIRRFLDFLEARFPAKVVVTEAELNTLRARISGQDNFAIGINSSVVSLAQRVVDLEKSLAAIKDALARGAIPFKTDKEALRDQFVKGEFSRGPQRQVVESEK